MEYIMQKVMWLHEPTQQVTFEYGDFTYGLLSGFGKQGCKNCVFLSMDDYGEGCNQAKSQALSCYAGWGDYAWNKVDSKG